jgi:hypothetical protein
MNDQTLAAGWAFPVNATKAHYFREGVSLSLCGKWRHEGPRHPKGKTLQYLHCNDCKRKANGESVKYAETLATLSPCGRYRYDLMRIWDHEKPAALFIMLNPSTADAEKDDPTIRRCVGFARSWGYGWLVVVNLFAWRATNPADLYQPDGTVRPEAIGPDNDETIIEHAQACPLIVAAWGDHGKRSSRAEELADNLVQSGFTLRCLGLNVSGQPKHPLYVKSATDLITYRSKGNDEARKLSGPQ